MSRYMDFDRCVVCRSKTNLKLYSKTDGPFEVTMLLNSLYLTVMHYIEKRTRIITEEKERLSVDAGLAKWLDENSIVDSGDNTFKFAQILRNLRNGLAHFNMKVFESEGHIIKIAIWSYDCCRESKCEGEEKEGAYKKFCKYEGDAKIKNAICIFTFSVMQLNTFAEMVMDTVLSEMPDACCKDCQYHSKEIPPVTPNR